MNVQVQECDGAEEKDEMCFEQKHMHIRQFANKKRLHKIISFFYYICMNCASFTLISRPQNVN